MIQTVILAIVEPLTFRAESSIAWGLRGNLKSNIQPVLSDAEGTVGTLIGAAPILQPTLVQLLDGFAFLIVLRGNVRVRNSFSWEENTYQLSIPNESTTMTLLKCTGVSQYAKPFLLMAASLGAVPRNDVEALQEHVGALSSQFWPNEPINFTTGRLMLASSGQYLTSSQITNSGLAMGTIIVDSGSVSIGPGAAPKVYSFKKWAGAGKVAPFVTAAGGSSSCGETSSFYSLGSSGGDDSFGGSGGDGGGFSYESFGSSDGD